MVNSTVSAGDPVQHAVDGLQKFGLAHDGDEIAPRADIAIEFLGRGIGQAQALLLIHQQQGIGQFAQHPVDEGGMGGELTLAFAPAAEGIRQMQAQLAIEPEGAGHRCRRTAPGRLLAGIAGKCRQMAQMGPQHDGQTRQHEEGGSECCPRRQAGKDDQPQQCQQAG